ncbi:DUF4837 family protein [Bacteroidota bacterium]
MSTKTFLTGIIFIFLLFSCKKSGKKERDIFLPNVSGDLNELLIVIDKEDWEEDLGKQIRSVLMQEQAGLAQPEPMFDILQIPTNAFDDFFKTHRNIIFFVFTNKVSEPKLAVKRNTWAKPQIQITFYSNNKKDLIPFIEEKSDDLIQLFLNMERERTMNYYEKYQDKKVRENLLKDHQVDLVFPKGYAVDISRDNFFLASHETTEVSEVIAVYYNNYTDTNQFKLSNIIQARNKTLKKYITGELEDSYMTTEQLFKPVYEEIEYKGRYMTQVRGIWKLMNDFMGGPFVSFTTLDEKRNRVVTVEGYVYAPKYEKRNYIRKLESILYTIDFPESVKNE